MVLTSLKLRFQTAFAAELKKRARLDQTLRVIRLAQAFGLHRAAGTGGVKEFSAAQIEADVRNARAGGVEKYQIAGLQVARADGAAGGSHIARTARQVHAEGVFVNILDHAAAIESGIGAAAPAVGCADQIHAVQHQFLPAGGAVDVADADVFRRFGGSLWFVFGFMAAGFDFSAAAAAGGESECGGGQQHEQCFVLHHS